MRRRAAGQIRFLAYEMYLLANRRWWRYITCLFERSFHVVACYRVDHCFYLMFGKGWVVARAMLKPILFLLSPWFGGCEIHYQSSIGRGLKVLHPSLGIVISKYAVIGERCTLTGGNCIGSRKSANVGVFMGDDITVGANAVIVGPVRIGSGATIVAGSVVLRDVGEWEVVGGVPAKLLIVRKPEAGEQGSLTSLDAEMTSVRKS